MPHNLSRRQLEVLSTLHRMAQERQYMPSVRELGATLGLSAATTQQHLSALRRKGYLASDGTAHGMRFLVEDIPPLLDGFDPSDEAEPLEAGHGLSRPARRAVLQSLQPPGELLEPTVPVPVIGRIAAGLPIEAVEVLDETIAVSASMARDGDYLLHVRGDSMIEDGILNGDLVLIRPQTTIDNGQIAVGLLEDGSATLKRIYREGERFRLQPANAAMQPIYVDRLRVQGRVVGLIRRY